MYSGEMVKFGSNRDGAKETILRVDDIGTDNNRSTINKAMSQQLVDNSGF